MAIKLGGIGKSTEFGTSQVFNYEFDNTQQQLINDSFLDEIGFVDYLKIDTTAQNLMFYRCTSDNDLFDILFDIIQCPQNINISLTPNYKFAQNNYRYKSDNYGQVCSNLFRDVWKLSIGVKGLCMQPHINEPTNMRELMEGSLNLLNDIVNQNFIPMCDSESINIPEYLNFSPILAGSFTVMSNPNMQIGLLNEAFGSVSASWEFTIIPLDFRKAIDNNVVFDVSLDCNVEERMVLGRLSINNRKFTPIGPIA